MIHEIEPHKFDNNYEPQDPTANDYLIFCHENKVLLFNSEKLQIPTLHEFLNKADSILNKEQLKEHLQYLFQLDEQSFFLYKGVSEQLVEQLLSIEGMAFYEGKTFRELKPMHMAFAGITGMHLARFASTHRFCGKCGQVMVHSDKERAYQCEACGTVEYPKISPAVIVAIIDKERDKILLTKYAYGEYRNYALVAGFVEVGESFEETVHREVLEEVGLKVKNVTYYKSQPWSFSDTIMVGFFAELDGDPTIVRQENELSEAVWMSREEMTDSGRNISIGHEMMELFRKGER